MVINESQSESTEVLLCRKKEHQEKHFAAFSSVIAAVGLTSFKIIIGISTGSLGILAEALHSALDLVAALITLFAISISDKPPDRDHHYGHGKIENLSAMFETLLLLATCIWIIYEGIHRLFFAAIHVTASFGAFFVMIVAIVIDFSRSRLLYKTARKYKSQALEADAMHFSTDIWSSSVVIFGLIGVKIADWKPGLSFMHNADSIAAIGVALIVAYVSIKLGIRALQALVDIAPAGVAEEIVKEVQTLQGVIDCHNVRVRNSGPYTFVDVHVVMDGNQSLEVAHKLTEEIEKCIQKIVPNADITVHEEPLEEGTSRNSDTPSKY